MSDYSVLFVDDEEELLNCLRRALADEPYQCHFVNSADQATAFLETQPVHVVVADVRMPGKTGIELLAELKETHPQVVRILLSGDPSIEPGEISNLVRAVHKGDIFKFIAKTVELDTAVKAVVQEALAFLESPTEVSTAQT